MLAVAAHQDLDVQQMDFSTAFLNGKLDEEVYMKGPPGTDLSGKQFRLIKSLYGLKQAPRCWNNTINTFLKENGFKQCQTDTCLYVRDKFYILLYVDDILLFTNDSQAMKEVKNSLMKHFDMHDLGELEFIVGIRVSRNREQKRIYLDQEAYCDRILEKFGMAQCNSAKTPLTDRLLKDPSVKQKNDFPYRALVGSLMYLMVGTRPDIAVACSELSRHLESPSEQHIIAAKRVLRYLAGTKKIKLLFDGLQSLQPAAYADADYANDSETRRSTSGYLLKVCNGAIVWKSKTQPLVALSTTEAKYYAESFYCQEICWVQECLIEIGFKLISIDMITDPQSHERSKLIPISLRIREHYMKTTTHVSLSPKTLKNILEQSTFKLNITSFAN